MLVKTLVGVLAVLLLGGCVADVGRSDVSSDHPASPDAASAAAPMSSDTLALVSAPPEAAGSASHDHSNHDHHSAATTRPTTTPVMYTCPHHPEVTSADPEARCPKCKMKLVKQTPAAGQSAGHGGH
jgi:hypothetical protein